MTVEMAARRIIRGIERQQSSSTYSWTRPLVLARAIAPQNARACGPVKTLLMRSDTV